MRVPFLVLLTLLSSVAIASPGAPGHDAPSIPGTPPPESITAPLPDSPESAFSESSSPLAGRGNRFTKKQKVTLKERNATANDGKVLCETCKVETVPGQKHEKDVTPPKNEAHTDHKVPRAKGGQAELDNGQILCRDCNIKKSDKAK